MQRALAAVILCLALGRHLPAQKLVGAGATFPYPLYAKWFSEYGAAHAGVSIRYQAIGSAAGVRAVSAGVVDFGATDVPMTDYQLASSRTKLVQVPALMGAVVPIFHLPGVSQLRLSGEVLADIYLGRISSWNDARIRGDNPDAELPDRKIFVVHRAEGSGTSYIFTDYLSKVSAAWARGPGRSSAPVWPTGAGSVHNEGVAHLQNRLEYAQVENKAGEWVKATTEGVAEAARSTQGSADHFRVSITDAPGAHAYPISSFTWLLIPLHPEAAKARVMRDLLTWIVTAGQSEAGSLAYTPLPKPVAERVLATLSSLR
jgi:phosphate transport system substrate-binding protein